MERMDTITQHINWLLKRNDHILIIGLRGFYWNIRQIPHYLYDIVRSSNGRLLFLSGRSRVQITPGMPEHRDCNAATVFFRTYRVLLRHSRISRAAPEIANVQNGQPDWPVFGCSGFSGCDWVTGLTLGLASTWYI